MNHYAEPRFFKPPDSLFLCTGQNFFFGSLLVTTQ
jgi:hypothetical protein